MSFEDDEPQFRLVEETKTDETETETTTEEEEKLRVGREEYDEEPTP